MTGSEIGRESGEILHFSHTEALAEVSVWVVEIDSSLRSE